MRHRGLRLFFFFFNDTATTEIYTLSLHDALPIWLAFGVARDRDDPVRGHAWVRLDGEPDRKSTRLNSSHQIISYAVFCLKKKTTNTHTKLQQHQPAYKKA